jgi:hypothetical protein
MARAELVAPVAPAASVAETVVQAVRVEHRERSHYGVPEVPVVPVVRLTARQSAAMVEQVEIPDCWRGLAPAVPVAPAGRAPSAATVVLAAKPQ